VGRRRTEDDARPTASGRRGRARGEEAGGIERIVEEEVTAADALLYPRCYSTHGYCPRDGCEGERAAARVGGGGRWECRPRGFAHGRQETRDFLLISC